jgi:hypothetical protein
MQGTFFVATGLWPIAGMRSFERVTGPKREHWLVKTMGGLIAVIGGALLETARSRSVRSPTIALGVGSAAALALSDVIYVRRRIIPKVYLVDAAAETALVMLWMAALRSEKVPAPDSLVVGTEMSRVTRAVGLDRRAPSPSSRVREAASQALEAAVVKLRRSERALRRARVQSSQRLSRRS